MTALQRLIKIHFLNGIFSPFATYTMLCRLIKVAAISSCQTHQMWIQVWKIRITLLSGKRINLLGSGNSSYAARQKSRSNVSFKCGTFSTEQSQWQQVNQMHFMYTSKRCVDINSHIFSAFQRAKTPSILWKYSKFRRWKTSELDQLFFMWIEKCTFQHDFLHFFCTIRVEIYSIHVIRSEIQSKVLFKIRATAHLPLHTFEYR